MTKAIFLDDEATELLATAAREEGLSPSAWVRRATQGHRGRRLPESFFATLGAWEDSREPEEILRDIRADVAERERNPLE